MRIRAAIIAMVILSVSCSTTVGTQAHGVQVQGIQPTEIVTVEYSIVGTVNVRSCPSTSCGVVGYYYAGDQVEADCFVANSGENWCSVPDGYVFAPCLGMEGVCR